MKSLKSEIGKKLKNLRSRIYDFERQKIDKERSNERKIIGTGDRLRELDIQFSSRKSNRSQNKFNTTIR